MEGGGRARVRSSGGLRGAPVKLKLGIPKGSLENATIELFRRAGFFLATAFFLADSLFLGAAFFLRALFFVAMRGV